MEDIAIKLLLSLLGIIIYTLFKALPYIQTNTFNIIYFLKDNKYKWLWSCITIILIGLVITLEPETAGFLKTFLGLDITNSNAAFFTLGLGVSNLVKDVSKNKRKINVENE
jgi:hypothetical protein